MTENFNILVNKLKAFRFKYYLFRIIKGFVITLFILLALYTLFSVIEYFVYLSSPIRKGLFYGFVIFGALLAIQFILVPVLKLFHVIKPMDLRRSSVMIHRHFGDIKDKLLNVIELSSISDSQYSPEILHASIDQKISQLDLFNFKDAVQFKQLKMVLVYFSISLIVTTTVFFIDRSVFTTATNRIIHFNQEFVKPAPFQFQLLTSNLQATKGEAFQIEVECQGDEIPQILYINIEGNNYLMKPISSGKFQFEISSVINPVQFYFTDGKFQSDRHFLRLLPNPGINRFQVTIKPPTYTELPEKVQENSGDLQVPEGTEVEWEFEGIDLDTVYVMFDGDSLMHYATQNEGAFIYNKIFNQSGKYHVYIKNRMTKAELALSYDVDVVPDLFPEIGIVPVQDSMKLTRFFFRGTIGDDYGFSDLQFHYNVNHQDSAVSIPFVPNLTDQEFYYSFDFEGIDPSSTGISYYFSVSDNDVINDYKTTTSDHYSFRFPDEDDILANENQQFKDIEDQLQQSREMARDIQKDLKNLRMKNMDSNISEWEKSQMVNDVLSKQSKLEKLYEQIKQDNEKLNNYLDSFKDQNQEVVDKQNEIEALLEEVFTDELRELMEEFNKLADEFDPRKLNQLSQQMDLSYEDLQKQLDRNLEMLRRMKVEQKIQEVIDKIQQMAETKKQLAKDILGDFDYENGIQQVEEKKQDIDRLQQQIEQALEMNEELERPLNFDDFSKEFDDSKNSMDETIQQMNKKNKRKSEEFLENAAQKLEGMAFAMQQMLDSNTMEQNMENIQNLRQILGNLVYLSFEQEEVLEELQSINTNDPLLNELNRKQSRIKNQSFIVKDSLYALAKRTPQINSLVNNELLTMEMNLDKIRGHLDEARFPAARSSQQYVITAANNLALILNEALENLEEQMANAQPGDQQCEKPGSGKPGMNMMKKSSENLKQQLQQMLDQMKNGEGSKMSEQMGKSLMQHEMMQQMLREIMNNGSVGSGARQTLQEIDKMLEQNRKELMNKNVNSRMIERQNQITTRLLEAEQAELEREFEDKRESETAEDFFSDPARFFDYKENKNFSIEYLNRNSHQLNNFYHSKYKNYLNNINE